MSYNFPDSPLPGDEFVPGNGPAWRYGAGAWRQTVSVTGSITGALYFDTMSEAQGAFVESDVQAIRLNGYYAPGDYGAALYVRVDVAPTHAGKLQSADGAWWEIREPVYTPQMFGAKGDFYHDDYPAMNACIQMPGNGIDHPPWYPSGPTVFIPGGYYQMTSAGRYGIQLKQRTHIYGEMTGQGNSYPGTTLKFPKFCNGFTVHQHNTIDNITEASGTGAGASSIIERIAILGTFSGADGDYHGIRLRSRATLRDLWIAYWDGNCIHINAYAGGGGDLEGNANNFVISTVGLYFSGRDGLFVEGPDANAGVVTMVNASRCGRWGIYDSSFLGNTYIACHIANAGASASGQNASFTPPRTAQVHYDGNRYVSATDDMTALANTVPGTNQDIWASMGAGGQHPDYITWLPGSPVGTYFYGGAIRTDGAAAQNLFLGCYMEGGQGSASFVGGTIVLGGTMHYNGYTAGGFLQGFDGGSIVARGANGKVGSNYGGTTDQFVGGDATSGTILSWDSIWRFHRAGQDYRVSYANSSTAMPFEITGAATGHLMGTTTPKPYLFTTRVLALGTNTSIRRQTTGTAAPTTLERARGDIVWNINPGVNGFAGFLCVVGGTPGTWVRFGPTIGHQEITTDALEWISALYHPENLQHTGTLTAARNFNLMTTDALTGFRYRITRTGAGAFNLNVTNNGGTVLKGLATNTWCEAVYNGSAWYLSAYGTL